MRKGKKVRGLKKVRGTRYEIRGEKVRGLRYEIGGAKYEEKRYKVRNSRYEEKTNYKKSFRVYTCHLNNKFIQE